MADSYFLKGTYRKDARINRLRGLTALLRKAPDEKKWLAQFGRHYSPTFDFIPESHGWHMFDKTEFMDVSPI